ncbi:MAG: serine hydrolase [Bacteroidota bacterium]
MKNLILLFFIVFFFSLEIKGQENTSLQFSSLEEAGFNRDSIETLINLIQETPSKDFRGLVVIKDNRIVIEEYFNTFMRYSVLDIRSAGKSITALALGVAMKEGLFESLDQSIYSLFSEKENPSINEDYTKFTIRNALNMSSGLDADSDNWKSQGQAGQWIERDDWKEYILNIPLIRTPGKRFVYADIHPLLIGLAIEEASGKSLKEYAQEKLFDPLGIHQVYWYTNTSNQTGAAGNLYLSTLDFAKLGMLVANEGKWGDSQIIDREYIKDLKNTKDPSIGDWYSLADTYGYFWYKSTRTFGGKTFDYLFASGNGGNQLIVIPEEGIVIALTASAYGQGYGHGRSHAIMGKVLSALE